METQGNRRVSKRYYMIAGLVVLSMAAGGALVFASVPHSFATGETLTADSLNGNFAALDQRLAAVESLLAPGTIVAFGGPARAASDGGTGAAPPGWLLCDGSAVSRATYANLFTAIGINFGGGDGISTFNLPDLRGRFLRGNDSGTGRDPAATARVASNPGGPTGDAVGTLEGDQYLSHQHTITDPGHTHGSGAAGGFMTWACQTTTLGFASGGNYAALTGCPGGTSGLGTTANTASGTTGITVVAAGGLETRPKNVAVNYLIKL
jgi:microcystin-dependent protein